LLDTHVFIWLVLGSRSVPPSLAEQLSDPDNELGVSAISAFEVATKVRLGKLDGARPLGDLWQSSVERLGARSLDLTSDHAVAAGALPWGHRDPFDRLLAAQAVVEGMTLVTADLVFGAAPGVDVLRW